MASPAAAPSSSGGLPRAGDQRGAGGLPRAGARLALVAVLLLGLVLGWVALFHQQRAAGPPAHGQQPPSAPATEVFGLDSAAGGSGPAATTQQQQEQQAPITAAAPNTTQAAAAVSTGRTGSPTTTAVTTSSSSNPKAAVAGTPSQFSAFTTAAGLPDKAPQGDVSAEADAVEGGGFLSVKGCTPEDGKELEALVEDSSCRIITLVPNALYNITAPMAVRRPIAIIGRPLGTPTLDAHLTFRTFQIEAGGRLDLRYVRIYRGKGRPVVPGALVVVQGAIAYVERSGAFAMTGCRVTIHPSGVFANVGISSNPRITTLILGGGVFSEGGTVRITGCFFFSTKPGIIWRETYFIGNEILILTGNVLITGCVFHSASIFTNTIGAGGFVYNVAGTVFITGCVFNVNGALYQSSGIGYLFFNSAGLTVATGCINNLQLGLAVFFGGGLGMFTGSGVTIMTGVIANVEGALSAGAGMGFQSAIGSGVVIRTGIIQNIHVSASFGCGVGHSQFIGSGTVVYTNIMLARTTMLPVFYGVGGYLFCGSGTITITNTVAALVNGIGITAGAGIGTMLMTGWLVRTNNLTGGISLILAVYGQGTDLMVMAGGAVLTFNRVVTRPPALLHFNEGLFGVWIAGNGFFLRPDMLVAVATHKGLWRLFENTTATGRTYRPGGGVDKNKTAALLPAPSKGHVRLAHWTYWVYKPPTPKKGAPVAPPSPSAPAPTPPPTVEPPQDPEVLIGIPFFGGRTRRQLQAAGDSSSSSSSSDSGSGSVPSAGAIAAAVGRLWALDDAGAYAALMGFSPSSASLGGGGEGEEEEGPDAFARIAAIVNAAGPATTEEAATAAVQQHEQGEHGVFIADTAFDSCRACAVGTRIQGPGAGACVVEPTCASSTSVGAATTTEHEQQQQQQEKKEEENAAEAEARDARFGAARTRWLEEMWVRPPGSGPANTSVAVLDLTADAGEAKDADAVAAAVNATVRALGLPERFHLRVVAPAALVQDELFSKYMEPEFRARRGLEGEDGVVVGEEEEEGGAGDWSPRRFKAYVVSDWGNVTAAVARGLSSARGGVLLSQHLANATTTTPTTTTLRARESLQLLIPGNGAGVFPGSTSFSTASSGGSSSSGTGGGGSGGISLLLPENEDVPSAVLYSTTRSATTDFDDENALLEEEEELAALVTDVRPGETYTLLLDNFPPAQLLSLRLTPPTGPARLLGLVGSSPSASVGGEGEGTGGGGVRWRWRVKEGTPPGDYFIEAASARQDAFAYTQAFRVVDV